MVALLYKDDHNKVAYLEKRKGWEAYEQILDFLNRSHIRYALTYRPTIVFDSLVKQFWATATVRTLEAGPSEIISTIDGNEWAGGDGADAAAANEVSPPPPPPHVPPTHTSSSTPGPSLGAQDTPMREPTLGTLKGKWRYLIPAKPPIHNHVFIPNYQDFKIQDFCYSDGFECFQAINIGMYEHVSPMSLKHKKDEITR
uniref:Xylulose kinase-1 n=1 Tax=Tanacetum cinerariifolium TaxID=118510 RepID=A0A699HNQ1_TANCI|nr:hypothetical protein [Tanacetum cinerariifolium]